MSTTYVRPGGLDADIVSDPWVLVLGGVTPVGNRRARRAVTEALGSGFDVVWFDGFEEKHPDTNERVPIDYQTDNRLQIVGFEEAETRTLAARLWSSEALRANAVIRVIWRHALRGLGSLLRPRACWTTIRSDVKRLSQASSPAAIILGDDQSITSGWYAGRIWGDAPLATKMLVNGE